MNGEIGTYTFLPWLRQGISNRIQSADLDASVKTRASITVDLQLKGTGGAGGDILVPVPKQVSLYGPGEVVGIESSAIIKTEPHDWVSNYEPNYLPCIEFYDEDFAWRYTPAAPAGSRLRPWLALIVLKEEEFSDGGNILDKPLPFIDIKALPLASVFPNAEQLWAWAHVHVNTNLAGSAEPPQAGDTASVLSQLESLLGSDPDMAYCRIICPRKLEPNTRYHAFLIPTFETGRLAGLGLDPATAPHATFSAWGEGRASPTLFPYYHRWFFRTGSRGDFEYLVRLLKPRPADERVGRRDMDVQSPGSNVSGIANPDLEGVLKLGGALLAPLSDEAEAALAKWEQWDQPYPHPFQSDLAQLVNLQDDYAAQNAEAANAATNLDLSVEDEEGNTFTDPDPLVTPPIYGRWHALTKRLLKEADGSTDVANNANWVHQLNLDPRWRSAAGFGTDVIIEHQEEYMDAAWDQVGAILEANRQIRFAQLAKQTSLRWYEKHLKSLQPVGDDKLVTMMAPVQKRVVNRGKTVYHQIKQSRVTPAITSAPLRRMLRPRARLHAYTYSNADASVHGNNLVTRVNAGQVTAAPPNTVPPGLPTVEEIAEELRPAPATGLVYLLEKYPWLRFVPLVLAVAVLVLLVVGAVAHFLGPTASLVGFVVFAALVVVWRVFTQYARQASDRVARTEAAISIIGENQTPDSVDWLPSSPDFELTSALDLGTLDPDAMPNPSTAGADDSVQATRFKLALEDAHALLQTGLAAGIKPEPVVLDVAAVAQASLTSLDPRTTIPRFVLGRIKIPAHIIDRIGESFVEAMAYPEFDIPMYKPLVERSTELFVPNLNFVPQNTITLLNTNQRFIEAYMVGLNHEFARELLWREYPTDQRGSYFRQFWDVSTFLSETADAAARREELKDIPPLDRWSKLSKLGDHDHREQGLENEEELVLVIRGELLKKYPNAVIYAHKARWQPKSDSDPTPDKTKEREFDPNVPIKSPLYEAKVKPDIYFFGFDLTEDEARGDDQVDDEPGWFFVIKERPGEPRFGLDIEREGPIQVWNDLAWPDVVPDGIDGAFIDLAATPSRSLPTTAPSGTAQEKEVQWLEDRHLSWSDNMSAAELAYILFQAPVLIGVHASEMLPPT